jgi:integrase
MSRVFKRDGGWWIDYNDASEVRRREKVAASKRVAEEILNKTLDKVAREKFLGLVEEKEEGISFARFVDEVWLKRVEHTLRPRTLTRWKGIVENHLKAAFRGALRAIDLAAVELYRAHRLQALTCKACDGKQSPEGPTCSDCDGTGKAPAVTPSTVNREVSILRHVLKRAVEWKYLHQYRLAGLKQLPEPDGRTRFLELDQIDSLLRECETSRSRSLKPFVLIALNTGMRRGEILGLTRKSIDWANKIATLSHTKNGDARKVHLNDTAIDALRLLPIRFDGRLFPLKDAHTVSRSFRRAVERAGIEDFRLHDLRHTFASHQAMAGTAGRGLQELLGHKDGRMTARYTHLSDGYLKAAVNGLNLGAREGNSPEDGTHLAPAQKAARA